MSKYYHLINGFLYFGVAGILLMKEIKIIKNNNQNLKNNNNVDSLYNDLLNNYKSQDDIFYDYKNKIKLNDTIKKNYPFLYQKLINYELTK